MKHLPSFLLISGNGQNSGKTTLACKLISAHKKTNLIAVKISPHFHASDYTLPMLHQEEDFVIYREIFADKNKDSSRFLKVGAAEVLVVFCQRDALPQAVERLLHFIPSHRPVVCESGGLSSHFRPGLHIFVTGNNGQKKAAPAEFDINVSFNGKHFDADLSLISLENNRWKLKP